MPYVGSELTCWQTESKRVRTNMKSPLIYAFIMTTASPKKHNIKHAEYSSNRWYLNQFYL